MLEEGEEDGERAWEKNEEGHDELDFDKEYKENDDKDQVLNFK